MSKTFSKFIQLGIVSIWISLVVVLVYRTYISGNEITPLRTITGSRFKTSEEWHGVYLQDRKIGYIKTTAEKIGDEFRFSQSGEIEAASEGKTEKSSMEFTCLTDSGYRIKSFDFKTAVGGNSIHYRGDIDENNMLLVFMDSGDRKNTRAEQIAGRPYLPLTLKHMLFAQGLEKGKRFHVPVLNIFSLNVEDTIVEVQDLIPVKVGINVNTAYLLKIGNNYSWLSDGGNTLKEADASGLLYLAEPKDLAASDETRPFFDFLSFPVLKSDAQLSGPEELSRITLRISGIDMSQFPLLNEGRQTMKGDVLVIEKENYDLIKERTYDLPYEKEDLAAYLGPTPYIQSDHHTVIYNAKKFVDIEKNAFRLARYLASNLFLTIKKIPSSHIMNTMDIFKTHTGESNEHTVMFASFARAGGLPARTVGGLVYLRGHFYYHTWVEVWIDQWVPADPAMGQFPADVTHIRLMEGDMDELASLGKIIGSIKIDIMEAL